jgi:uncharacterized integral membrane protein
MTFRRLLSRAAHAATWGYAIVGIIVLVLLAVWVFAWSGLGHWT